MCKRHQYVTIAVLLIFAIVGRGISTAWGLDSCELERPSEVVSFQQGSFPSGASQPSHASDPSILLRSSSVPESLRLGVGGSIILQFTVPIANYPAAGALTIERPTGAVPCSSHPVRAEVSGSIDGVNFISLGSTCETAAFDLGAFPWIAYLRIKDVTDTSDPRFGATPVSGFDLRAVSGPGCLKYSHCAVAPIADSAASDRLNAYALSLSHLGNDFVFEKPASFEEYGNGSARLSGTAHQVGAPSTVFDVTISFSGKVQSPPPKSPVLELKPSAYTAQGGPVDPSTWHYYKHAQGTLIGEDAQSGTRISLDGTLLSLQVGEGANGRDTTLGASGSVTYATASSPSTAEITIDLTSCSTTPSSPTPEPTPPPEYKEPTCQKEDVSNTLVALDSNLRGRVTIINRATRLLIQNRRSVSNVRFTTEARAKAHNLYSRAWSDVWKQDRTILTCAPSTLCFDVHLEPSQAALAASAEALDNTVKRTLKTIEKRASSRKAKQEIRNLLRKHTIQRQRFIEKLATLPGHSTLCR